MDEAREHRLRTLLEMAWADGQLQPAEKEVLVEILVRLGFSAEEVEQGVEPVSEAFVLPETFEDREHRLQVLSDLVAVAFADRDLSLEEFAYLEKVAKRLQIDRSTLMGMIRGVIEKPD